MGHGLLSWHMVLHLQTGSGTVHPLLLQLSTDDDDSTPTRSPSCLSFDGSNPANVDRTMGERNCILMLVASCPDEVQKQKKKQQELEMRHSEIASILHGISV